MRFRLWRWPWWPSAKHSTSSSASTELEPSPADFPVFPPPPPRAILQDRQAFWGQLQLRKYAAPRGVFEDAPLYALCRFYEFILVDQVRPYRNVLEAFWRKKDWAVQDIPDPEDEDAERYACLAACTYLVARAFNERVKLGLAHMPPLLLPEEAEHLKNVPDHLRHYEEVPRWARRAPPLKCALSIPTHDEISLDGKQDERADLDFLAKNILTWTPHISFTRTRQLEDTCAASCVCGATSRDMAHSSSQFIYF